jgi:uncharacterized protein HemX
MIKRLIEPYLALIALAAVVALAAAVWIWGQHKEREGVRKTTATFLKADREGAKNARAIAEETLRDIGDDPDVDRLLETTNGWRD